MCRHCGLPTMCSVQWANCSTRVSSLIGLFESRFYYFIRSQAKDGFLSSLSLLSFPSNFLSSISFLSLFRSLSYPVFLSFVSALTFLSFPRPEAALMQLNGPVSSTAGWPQGWYFQLIPVRASDGNYVWSFWVDQNVAIEANGWCGTSSV